MAIAPIDHTELPTLRGKSCWLRPLRVEDVSEAYVAWLNDPLVSQFLESRFVDQTIDSVGAFVAAQVASGSSVFMGIWVGTDACPEGRHVGNIKLGPIDRHHLSSDLGFLIGERDCWGRGIGSEAIALIVELGFQLGLVKITASAYETNPGSGRALQKAGFAFEGYRPSQVVSGDRRVGINLYGISCS